MNVLHINGSDLVGGAAIAANRLHNGLLAKGVDSHLLVGSISSESDRVATVPQRHFLENQLARITWRLGLNYINILSTFKISRHPFYEQADVLNFHNLHDNYFNYLAISSLTARKPAVFTLHDMWSFTGHCSYSYDCERWKTGCGRCPHLDVYPTVPRDNTRIEWKLKKLVYDRANLSIVTPSNWLTEQARQSILARFPIHNIPNGVDTDVYKPLNSEQSRLGLGIPVDKKVLLFGAQSLHDTRKGGDLLLKALQSLPGTLRSEILLLVMGEGGEKIAKSVDIQTRQLGYITSDSAKALAYSAADVFIFPTRADNLPLVLQESMACGTPMVSFRVGGVPELVRHYETGLLAEPGDANALSESILHLLEDSHLRNRLSRRCREIALEEYSLELQIVRYIELYNQLTQQMKRFSPQ
jgi:glycosyltransferase involved in cell wall biosynthesis